MWQDVWPALGLSLKVAFWATFLNLLLGIAVGFLLARRNFPGRDLLDTALTLPMVLPPASSPCPDLNLIHYTMPEDDFVCAEMRQFLSVSDRGRLKPV